MTVLGPNGGGKTTLFKTILGLVPAIADRLDGEDMGDCPLARGAHAIGYVPQAAPGYFPFTVNEMVLMCRTAHLGAFAAPGRADRSTATRVVGDLGISHLADRDYTRISASSC